MSVARLVRHAYSLAERIELQVAAIALFGGGTLPAGARVLD